MARLRWDRKGKLAKDEVEAVTYQYFKNTGRSLSFDADAVDLANLVSNVNEAGSIGRAAVHYSRYHNLPGDLARFYGRPLLSTCKLMFSLRCEVRVLGRAFIFS